jgi:hypothetical protein
LRILRIVNETAKYVVYEHEDGYYAGKTTKEKKFLCIGGPFAEEFKSRSQINGEYHGFNKSAHSAGSWRDRKAIAHTMVWIHKDLL